MAGAKNLSIELLKGIRDELNGRVDGLNGRVDGLNGRVDGLNEHVERMREDLSRRIVESGVRTATAIADLAGTVREMTAF